jgi:hypothetical protein
MIALLVLAILAVTGWNIFVQLGARQQVSVPVPADITAARQMVASCFGITWSEVDGRGEDNFRPRLRSGGPVLSVGYSPNGAGGTDVEIWCSHFRKRYGCMEHAQLMWRKKVAVSRALARTTANLPHPAQHPPAQFRPSAYSPVPGQQARSQSQAWFRDGSPLN